MGIFMVKYGVMILGPKTLRGQITFSTTTPDFNYLWSRLLIIT